MRIEIDTESGFCFGVTSAIRKAEEELQSGTLSVLGDIVHNGQEVARLEALGLKTIAHDDLPQHQGERVLLRAHGEPPSTYALARDNNIEVIDATCPVVKKLQERIRTCYQQSGGRQIVIFGKVGHAEVVGLCGQTDNTAIVVEGLQDIDKIDFSRDIYLFSQTTKSVDEFNTIVAAIQSKVESQKSQVEQGKPSLAFHYYDTICRNVANRVAHLKDFARRHDIIIFVGGKKSSNAKVLYEHCLEANPRTFFVEDATQLRDHISINAAGSINTKGVINAVGNINTEGDFSIGICGATSTPLWLMERCRDTLNMIYEVAMTLL